MSRLLGSWGGGSLYKNLWLCESLVRKLGRGGSLYKNLWLCESLVRKLGGGSLYKNLWLCESLVRKLGEGGLCIRISGCVSRLLGSWGRGVSV